MAERIQRLSRGVILAHIARGPTTVDEGIAAHGTCGLTRRKVVERYLALVDAGVLVEAEGKFSTASIPPTPAPAAPAVVDIVSRPRTPHSLAPARPMNAWRATLRPGALDYQGYPSVSGGQERPYIGPTSAGAFDGDS